MDDIYIRGVVKLVGMLDWLEDKSHLIKPDCSFYKHDL